MLKINRIQIIIICIILIIITGICYYFYENSNKEDINFLEENILEEKPINIEQESELQEIIIHIAGEVINPGIVKLKEDARIIDAIEAAGGTTNEADLSKVNLAYVLSDGQKVYIPSVNDKEEKQIIIQESGENIISNDGNSNQIKVNINSATLEQLTKLPGIGESIAQKIITYRNQNGKFSKIEDIKNVSRNRRSKV